MTVVGIGLTHVLDDTQLRNETFVLGEAAGVGGQIRQDEAGGDGDSDGGSTFNPEKPTPGSMAKGALHVGQDAGGDQGGEGVGDEVATEQDGVPGGQLAARVPLGQNQQRSRQEGSLDKAQQEPDDDHVLEVLGVSGQRGDETPQGHGNGNVQGRARDAVDDHVGGHLHENVSDVQDTQTGGELGVGEAEVLLQTLETGGGDIVAVEIVHDVDQHEDAASQIELPLQTLLGGGTTGRVHLRQDGLLDGDMLEVLRLHLVHVGLDGGGLVERHGVARMSNSHTQNSAEQKRRGQTAADEQTEPARVRQRSGRGFISAGPRRT